MAMAWQQWEWGSGKEKGRRRRGRVSLELRRHGRWSSGETIPCCSEAVGNEGARERARTRRRTGRGQEEERGSL